VGRSMARDDRIINVVAGFSPRSCLHATIESL
jgi:hypothetical protein